MIDTDKYEGHEYERMRIERWHLPDTPEEVMIANALLMDDAPLLLAEVKRLREQQQKILRLAETNMALEWGDTNHSFEWGYIVDMIKGWTE